MSSQASQKDHRLLRNNCRWEPYKNEIRRFYITENNTLSRTMAAIEIKHGFKASPRKWKMKLKEWKFDKYRTKKDLGTVVAKVVTCAREEDGDTTFDNGRLIPLSKVENLKERESARDSGAASPNAETLPHIDHFTPDSENNISIDGERIVDVFREVTDGKSFHSINNFRQKAPAAALGDIACLEFPYTSIYSSRSGPVVNINSAPPHLDSQPAGNLPSLAPLTNAEFLRGDSPNFDTQFVFPRHRLEPMCISEASAKEAKCLAVAYWHAEDFANAEQAYLDAISQYSHLWGCDNLLVCQLRSNLADTQAHLHRLDESISTRRQIIAVCWLKYGENAHETLHYTEKLAGVLALQKQDEEAHFLYRKAADGYEKSGSPALRLRCLGHIIRLFRERGCEGAALPVLHSAFVGYLSLPSEDYGVATETHDTIVLLQNLYLKLGRGGRWNEVISKLSHMQRLMETESTSSPNPVPKVICEAINLAHIFSSLREFDTAEPLFQLGLARFEVAPKSTTLHFVKATVQYRYATHLSRKGDIISCAKYLILAFENLAFVGPRGDELAIKVGRGLVGIVMELEHYPSSEIHEMLRRIRAKICLFPYENTGFRPCDDGVVGTVSTESCDTNKDDGVRTLADTSYSDGHGANPSVFEMLTLSMEEMVRNDKRYCDSKSKSEELEREGLLL